MNTVFDVLKRSGKRFVFTSSQMSNMNFSPYGELKSLGECYTRSLGGVITKFWNVYGVERDLEKSHCVTDFVLKAKMTGGIDERTVPMSVDAGDLR